MRLKKINAALGLLSILLIVLHIGYSVFAYLTFYYNPLLKNLFAIPFLVIVFLHATLGMLVVFTQKDGSRMDLYKKQNARTILQRVSAALIFPLLILHINTFRLMQQAAEKGQSYLIILLIVAELGFFAVVIIHVVSSFTRGLITLGVLSSEKTCRILDRICYILGVIAFLLSAYAVVKGQAAMRITRRISKTSLRSASAHPSTTVRTA